MKALIGFLSLVAGGVVIALIVKLQTDPFAFTSHVPVISETPTETAQAAAPPAVMHANMITLADVEIDGHITRTRNRAPVRIRAKAAPAPKPKVTVIAPPCVNGQYRKLEPGRGVRLMCPH